jgi:bifunctional non-homologous end joining protein LigD
MAKARSKGPGEPANSSTQLARYRSMRDFEVTSEPSGTESAAKPASQDGDLPFVIQKHAATRLHYDFRLGWNGVLKSWAVTKGPSYFPGDKRLAVQVEDHPMEYGGFEGIIPKGQYGGGTVMLWDRGTWEPHVNVEEGLEKGSLKFALHGEKLKGNWALVRMGGRAANASKPNWLLIKEHDAEERSADAEAITEELPDSVLSGRDIETIARGGDRVWQSNREEKKASAASEAKNERGAKNGKPQSATTKKLSAKDLKGARRESLPEFVSPQLATLAKAPPSGERWVHELKLDGYRIQIRIDGKKKSVQLLTRTGLDWTHRMKSIAEAARELGVDAAILDGEVVVLNENGTTSFAALQASFQEGARYGLTYFAFDLLHLNGFNVRELPLMRRKELLAELMKRAGDDGVLRMSEHLTGDATRIFREACKLGSEGIVSKLSDAPYSSGRTSGWLKAKCHLEQEFVIGGFTLPSNDIYGVGALLLGYYRGEDLIFAGRTGTGFTQKTHQTVRDRLEKIRRAKAPFDQLPAGEGRGVQWVKPELVAEVSFANWTADNLVRQASFKGLREDKPASAVRREVAEEDLRGDKGRGRKEKSEARDEHAANRHAADRHGAGQQLNANAVKKNANAAGELGVPIRLTHPDKVLDAESGVTKAALARYYQDVAAVMLPHIADRPLTLVRCVDGTGKPCFYQKHKTDMLSGSFGSVEVVDKKSGKPEPYITIGNETAVVELAQIGVLEVHPWGSRNEALETPDRLIFDLDPDAAIGWERLAASAIEVRKRLEKLGLKSFVKSTGGKGLHIVAPIRAEHPWNAVKQFAHDFVVAMEKNAPQLYLTKMTKAARVGKIYLDYLRNERGSTAVAPFSPRARAGLPVAVPLSWSELSSTEAPRYTVAQFAEWKGRLKRDPWKAMQTLDQQLHLSA